MSKMREALEQIAYDRGDHWGTHGSWKTWAQGMARAALAEPEPDLAEQVRLLREGLEFFARAGTYCAEVARNALLRSRGETVGMRDSAATEPKKEET